MRARRVRAAVFGDLEMQPGKPGYGHYKADRRNFLYGCCTTFFFIAPVAFSAECVHTTCW